MNLYNKIQQFLCKYIYLVYAILLFILYELCFLDWVIYIFVFFIVFITIFIDDTNCLGLLLFILPFENLINETLIGFYLLRFLKLFLVSNLLIRHILVSIKNKSSCNIKVIISLSIFAIYLLLPMHEIGFLDFILIFFELCLIYIIFQRKLKIKYEIVFEIFVISMICCSLIGCVRFMPGRLQEILPEVKVFDRLRFSGVFEQPNVYGEFIVIAISLLCISKYFNKINNFKFVIFNCILVFFGICALSRSFICSICILYLTHIIVHFIKYKKENLKDLIFLYVGLLLVSLISLDKLIIMFDRFSYNQVFENIDFSKNPELWEKILNGEIRYDPGRKKLWEIHLKDIISSPMVLFFGRGITRPFIGQMGAHNHFIHFVWQNGLVGVVILIVNICMFINFKKISWKVICNKLYTLIFLLPLGFILLVEIHPMGKLLYSIFLMIFFMQDYLVKDENNLNKEVVQDKNIESITSLD